ncbi:PEP-CTERM sorting domain-containing protein [Pontiellaceae bacterium B12227]|nr:PEP-CTERM sorting domain-containing protein [Pontiellaceae bacterium B12227]
MKNWMIAAACLMAGAVSAELLVGWDGAGSDTPVNGTLGVSGTFFSPSKDTSRSSNDGWYGPDSVAGGGVFGASTNDTVGYKINGNGSRIAVKITNNSGDDLELSSLLFDYLSIWATGPQTVLLKYDYGALEETEGTLLATIAAPGFSGGSAALDYPDYAVDLQSALTDYTLADGQSATFGIEGVDASDGGVNGIVDNIAFTGTVIPEPATLGLLCSFSAGILFVRRRFCM